MSWRRGIFIKRHCVYHVFRLLIDWFDERLIQWIALFFQQSTKNSNTAALLYLLLLKCRRKVSVCELFRIRVGWKQDEFTITQSPRLSEESQMLPLRISQSTMDQNHCVSVKLNSEPNRCVKERVYCCSVRLLCIFAFKKRDCCDRKAKSRQQWTEFLSRPRLLLLDWCGACLYYVREWIANNSVASSCGHRQQLRSQRTQQLRSVPLVSRVGSLLKIRGVRRDERGTDLQD